MAKRKKPVPRPEHPRPHFYREAWKNLNGPWEFEIDNGRTGEERGLAGGKKLDGSILVPFCPESPLSGVGHLDFMDCVWYRRQFTVPKAWRKGRVLLHFGAVDYDARVWINGQLAGAHRGGFVGFCLDVTDLLRSGRNELVLSATDDVRSGLQPAGKQSMRYESHGCDYRRTTGIWQTVWLESVPSCRIRSFRLYPDPANRCVRIIADVVNGGGFDLCATARGEEYTAGHTSVRAVDGKTEIILGLDDAILWEPGEPYLYDLELMLRSGAETVDSVSSYFGLRTVSIDGKAICINGRPVFQRLVLDQGFYPDGIYTAPSDAALRRDIELSMSVGFNGARLHQKVFEERFLYWADVLGYVVWGEFGDWKTRLDNPAAQRNIVEEWLHVLERDFNHPSIVGWCPFNERHGCRDRSFLGLVYDVTKAVDSTRPVIDTSGYDHVRTDVYDCHDYDQDVKRFKQRHDAMIEDDSNAWNRFPEDSVAYAGQPYFVSEYGGIWWNPGQKGGKAWGYGNRPKSKAEFIRRFRGLTHALLDNPKICALCYTQLTDVEQEVNGVYTFDRKPKFNAVDLRKILTRKAAIEKGS